MENRTKKAALNRAVFVQRPYLSSGLTVLTTLFHCFREPGVYEVFIQRDGRVIQRLKVKAGVEKGQQQHNLDMAVMGVQEKGCCPEDETGIELINNGVLGFYASTGTSSYTVLIQRLDEKEKRVVLDSGKEVPEGDLFAVTLVYPGIYRVSDELNRAEAQVEVMLPEAPAGKIKPQRKAASKEKPYRPDQPSMVQAGKGGFSPKKVSLFSGQTLVIHCQNSARLRMELVKPDKEAMKAEPGKQRTVGRPPAAPAKK